MKRVEAERLRARSKASVEAEEKGQHSRGRDQRERGLWTLVGVSGMSSGYS